MAYASWSVVFGEQPSAAKWNILGTNDASFNDGTGISAGVIGNSQLATGVPVQRVATMSSSGANGATVIPHDDTIPQITEGTEFITASITPKSATNTLVIEASLYAAVSPVSDIIAALFQDATANALAAITVYAAISEGGNSLKLVHSMTAGTTSSTTFRVRIGPSAAATIWFNGNSAGRRFGATSKSSIIITEHKA